MTTSETGRPRGSRASTTGPAVPQSREAAGPVELAAAAGTPETAGDGKAKGSGKSRSRGGRTPDLLALGGVGHFPALAEYRYMERAVYRQYDMDATRRGLPREPFLGRVRFILDEHGDPAEHVEPLMRGTLRVGRCLRLRDIVDRAASAPGAAAGPGRPGETHGGLVELTYDPPDPGLDAITALIDPDEFDRPRDITWTRSLGMQGFYDPRDLPEIKGAVLAMIAGASITDTYTKTGVLVREGLPDVWVRFGRPALLPAGVGDGFDDSATGMVPPEYADVDCLSLLTYADPSTPETARGDAQALLDLMSVWPDQAHIPAAMLAELAWAPWSFAFGRVVVIVTGKSADFAKTTLAGQAIAYQSGVYLPSPSLEPPVIDMRGQGTVLGLTQAIHAARGALVCADDMITKHMTTAELARQVKIMDGAVSQVRTGRGHPRGGHRNGRTTVSVSKAPTGCLMITLEELPNESRLFSLVGRAAVLRTRPVTDAEAWAARMTRAQESAPAAARALSGFIAWALADWRERAGAALADARKVVSTWRAQYGGHKNTVKTYSALLAGAWMLTEYARGTGAESPFDMAELLETAFREQARRSGEAAGEHPATDPEQVFATGFRALLAAGRMYLAAPELSSTTGYARPALAPADLIRCGWRAVTRRDSSGAALVDWEHPGGPPAGAVAIHVPGGPGKPPVYPRRILIGTTEWDQVIVPAVRAWAQEQDGVLIPDGPELRDVLTRTRMMHRADAKDGAPAFLSYGNRARRYVLDLDRVVMAAEESGPETEDDGTETSGTVVDLGRAVSEWVESSLATIATMAADQLDHASVTSEIDQAEAAGHLSTVQAERIRAARIRRLRELSAVPAPRTPGPEFVDKVSALIESAAGPEDLQAIDWTGVRTATSDGTLDPGRVAELRNAYRRKWRELTPARPGPEAPAERPARRAPKPRTAPETTRATDAVGVDVDSGALVAYPHPLPDGTRTLAAVMEWAAGLDLGAAKAGMPWFRHDGIVYVSADAAAMLGLPKSAPKPGGRHEKALIKAGWQIGTEGITGYTSLWRGTGKEKISRSLVILPYLETERPDAPEFTTMVADDGMPAAAGLARRQNAFGHLVDAPMVYTGATTAMALLKGRRPVKLPVKDDAGRYLVDPEGKRVFKQAPYGLEMTGAPMPRPIMHAAHPDAEGRTPEQTCQEEDYTWIRGGAPDSVSLTLAEQGAGFAIGLDTMTSFASVLERLIVPLGTYEHVTEGIDPARKGIAGFGFADLSGIETEPELPHFATSGGQRPTGPGWYTLHTLNYARTAYGWQGQITEGYVTGRAGALFEPWWPPLRDAYLALMVRAGVTPELSGQEFLTAHAAYKDVADAETLALLAMVKSLYKDGVGKFRQGPNGIGADSIERWLSGTVASPWHRPDVRAYVLAAARTGSHYRYRKTFRANGRAPFAVSHDRAVYACESPSPLDLVAGLSGPDGRPLAGTVRLGVRPGSMKLEGMAPLPELLTRCAEQRRNPADLVSEYVNGTYTGKGDDDGRE